MNQNGGIGDCVKGFKKVYEGLVSKFDKVPAWKDIPMGLGAWGIEDTQENEQDKIDCLLGIKKLQESGEYPQLRASIYFNSNHGRIATDQQADLIPTFKEYLNSSKFYHEGATGTEARPITDSLETFLQ